jgi:hypothetical protein
MKNFSFKTIVEEIENQKSLADISQFIKSYFLTIIGKDGYGWKEIPKNNFGFGAIIRLKDGGLMLLKDGDYIIDKKYEKSWMSPHKDRLKSTSFDYKRDKAIPIEDLSKEELNDVYNSIFSKVQSEMSSDTSKYRGD